MTTKKEQENPLHNILINVLIPVFALSFMSKDGDKIWHIGATKAMMVALIPPLAYGIWFFMKTKKMNFFSLLGLISVALTGGLGAGKTHFTKGLVRGLGGTEEVTSPTFTLVHEYSAGRLPVFHFDFYRIETERELTGIGWDEYLDAGGVCVVEWADRFPDLLPASAAWWSLEPEGPGRQLRRRL